MHTGYGYNNKSEVKYDTDYRQQQDSRRHDTMLLFRLMTTALLLSPIPTPPSLPSLSAPLVATTSSSSSSSSSTVMLSLSALDGMKGTDPVLPEEELTTSYNRGNAYLMQGQFEDALSSFNRAMELSPNNADILLSRGIVYEKLFKWQNAIDDYQLANSVLKLSLIHI